MTKPNPENCKNCPSKCGFHCAQLSYRTQHGAVLIIFPLNLQTSITAQILSIGGEGVQVDEENQEKLASSNNSLGHLPKGLSSSAHYGLFSIMKIHNFDVIG